MPGEVIAFSEEAFNPSFRTMYDYANYAQTHHLWVDGVSQLSTSLPQMEGASSIRIAELADVSRHDGLPLMTDLIRPHAPAKATCTYQEWLLTAPDSMQEKRVNQTLDVTDTLISGPPRYRALTPLVVCEIFGRLAVTEPQLVTATSGLASWCRRHQKERTPTLEERAARSVLAQLIARSVYICDDYQSPPKEFMDVLTHFGDWQDSVRLTAGRALAAIMTQNSHRKLIDTPQLRQFKPANAAKAAIAFHHADLLTPNFWLSEGVINGGTIVSPDFLRTFHSLVRSRDTIVSLDPDSRNKVIYDYIHNLLLSYGADGERNQGQIATLREMLHVLSTRRREALVSIVEKAEDRGEAVQPHAYGAKEQRIRLAPALYGLLADTRSEVEEIREEQREQDRLHCRIIAGMANGGASSMPLVTRLYAEGTGRQGMTGSPEDVEPLPAPSLAKLSEKELFTLRDAGLYAELLRMLRPPETRSDWTSILLTDLSNASGYRLSTGSSSQYLPGLGESKEKQAGTNPGHLGRKRAFDPSLDTKEGRATLFESCGTLAGALTEEETLLLETIIQEGKDARRELIQRYTLFVLKLARKIGYVQGTPWDVRLFAGYEGLSRSVHSYDPEDGFAFTTFAGRSISGAMIKASLEHFGSQWGVKSGTAQRILRMRQIENQLAQELGSAPSYEQIAKRMGVRLVTIRKYMGYLGQHPISIDTGRATSSQSAKHVGGRGTSVQDDTAHHLVPVWDMHDISDDSRDQGIALMQQAFTTAQLTELETQVLCGRFGMPPYESALSEKELSEHLQKSRAAIQVAYMAATQKMQQTPHVAEILRRNLRA